MIGILSRHRQRMCQSKPSLGDEKENKDVIQWTYVETYDTLKEANAERKKMPVKYSNYQTSKSSGRSTRFFKCKTHVDCGSELRLSDASGKYVMTINNVQHAEPLANSCGIGYQFKDEIDTMIASGVQPVNILSTLRGKYENTEHHAYLPIRKQIASYKASKSHSHLDTGIFTPLLPIYSMSSCLKSSVISERTLSHW